jgi:hypothetical protein
MMSVDRTEQLRAAFWWIDPLQGLISFALALALIWALLSMVLEPDAIQVAQVRADAFATVVTAQSTRIAILERTPTPTTGTR